MWQSTYLTKSLSIMIFSFLSSYFSNSSNVLMGTCALFLILRILKSRITIKVIDMGKKYKNSFCTQYSLIVPLYHSVFHMLTSSLVPFLVLSSGSSPLFADLKNINMLKPWIKSPIILSSPSKFIWLMYTCDFKIIS